MPDFAAILPLGVPDFAAILPLGVLDLVAILPPGVSRLRFGVDDLEIVALPEVAFFVDEKDEAGAIFFGDDDLGASTVANRALLARGNSLL